MDAVRQNARQRQSQAGYEGFRFRAFKAFMKKGVRAKRDVLIGEIK